MCVVTSHSFGRCSSILREASRSSRMWPTSMAHLPLPLQLCSNDVHSEWKRRSLTITVLSRLVLLRETLFQKSCCWIVEFRLAGGLCLTLHTGKHRPKSFFLLRFPHFILACILWLWEKPPACCRDLSSQILGPNLFESAERLEKTQGSFNPCWLGLQHWTRKLWCNKLCGKVLTSVTAWQTLDCNKVQTDKKKNLHAWVRCLWAPAGADEREKEWIGYTRVHAEICLYELRSAEFWDKRADLSWDHGLMSCSLDLYFDPLTLIFYLPDVGMVFCCSTLALPSRKDEKHFTLHLSLNFMHFLVSQDSDCPV